MVEEGYRVLRFTGKQVEFETRAVCDALDAVLRSTRSQGSISLLNRIARDRHEKWPVALGTVLPLTPPPLSPDYRGEGSQEFDFVRNGIESDATHNRLIAMDFLSAQLVGVLIKGSITRQNDRCAFRSTRGKVGNRAISLTGRRSEFRSTNCPTILFLPSPGNRGERRS